MEAQRTMSGAGAVGVGMGVDGRGIGSAPVTTGSGLSGVMMGEVMMRPCVSLAPFDRLRERWVVKLPELVEGSGGGFGSLRQARGGAMRMPQPRPNRGEWASSRVMCTACWSV